MDATIFPLLASTTTDVLLQPREDAVGRFVVRDSGRTLTRRERPRRCRLPRLHVDYLNGVLAFVVDENVPLAVCGGACGRRVFELDGRDDVAGLGIDRGKCPNRPAAVRQNDFV